MSYVLLKKTGRLLAYVLVQDEAQESFQFLASNKK